MWPGKSGPRDRRTVPGVQAPVCFSDFSGLFIGLCCGCWSSCSSLLGHCHRITALHCEVWLSLGSETLSTQAILLPALGTVRVAVTERELGFSFRKTNLCWDTITIAHLPSIQDHLLMLSLTLQSPPVAGRPFPCVPAHDLTPHCR